MAELEKGITRAGEGYAGKSWNILGQLYFPKASCESSFAFETNSEPGQYVPVHVHPTQDEFILVQEGVLDLKLDGVWVQAKAGDLVRLVRARARRVACQLRRAVRAARQERVQGGEIGIEPACAHASVPTATPP